MTNSWIYLVLQKKNRTCVNKQWMSNRWHVVNLFWTIYSCIDIYIYVSKWASKSDIFKATAKYWKEKVRLFFGLKLLLAVFFLTYHSKTKLATGIVHSMWFPIYSLATHTKKKKHIVHFCWWKIDKYGAIQVKLLCCGCFIKVASLEQKNHCFKCAPNLFRVVNSIECESIMSYGFVGIEPKTTSAMPHSKLSQESAYSWKWMCISEKKRF